MRLALVLLVCGFVLFPASSGARTWFVRQDGSGDCTAIQPCIDSASPGDSVLVGPGDYYELLTISGKNIVLISELGPGTTVIHGGNWHRVIHCTNIPATALIQGITITEGQVSGSYWPNNAGSGIFCESSDVHIIGNVITDNFGDGIAADAATALYVSGNTISYNYGEWADPGDIPGCGVRCLGSQTLIENNEFVANWGPAVECQGGSPVVRRNVMTNGGIGVACFSSSQATIYENVILDGTSAGVFVTDSSPTVRNNTLVANRDGIRIDSGSPLVENNIVVNSTRYGMMCAGIGPSFPSLHCNDVWGNLTNYYMCTPGPGDFSADPLFCAPQLGDYHINCVSPCAPPAGGECGLVGALAVRCGPTTLRETTWGRIKVLYR